MKDTSATSGSPDSSRLDIVFEVAAGLLAVWSLPAFAALLHLAHRDLLCAHGAAWIRLWAVGAPLPAVLFSWLGARGGLQRYGEPPNTMRSVATAGAIAAAQGLKAYLPVLAIVAVLFAALAFAGAGMLVLAAPFALAALCLIGAGLCGALAGALVFARKSRGVAASVAFALVTIAVANSAVTLAIRWATGL